MPMTDTPGDWIDKAVRPPTAADMDVYHCALCWHVYQGLMIQGLHNITHNRFITHWMPSPDPPQGAAGPEEIRPEVWRV